MVTIEIKNRHKHEEKKMEEIMFNFTILLEEQAKGDTPTMTS